MDFDKEINLDELAKNINMRRELEAQETTSEPVQEYLNMDKITLVKMLLASKEENKYNTAAKLDTRILLK